MPALYDNYRRQIEYIRVSVTDQCDLRCFYCLPKGFKDFDTPDHWLTFTEIERVISAFGQLGVKRVRLTGGEPLVRKNIDQLAARLSALNGIDDLSLSTNATRLGKYADSLYQAGVKRINVSLDTLRADRFRDISGGKLDKTIDGILAAARAGFSPIKINMVVMRGVNDDEIEDMVDFCIKHDLTLRMIETMPMGDTGREASNLYVDLQTIRQQLAQRYELIPDVMPGGGPARYVRVAGTDLRIGFITPLSQHFCDTCNRVRLTADGTLYMCLGQSHSVPLRPLLRAGISDVELLETLREAVKLKPERHEFNENPQKIVRFMSHTGG